MLHAHSMALLVDSNVLTGILPRSGDMADIYGALARWIATTLKRADQKPVGKTVTLIVTTGILRDYRSGFGRNKYGIDSHAWARFKKSVNKRELVGCKTHFMISKIQPKVGGGRRWAGDKYDKAYFEALESAVGIGRLRDRHIVFVSADRATSDRMAAEFPPSEYGGRLHIVDSRDALDCLIMD